VTRSLDLVEPYAARPIRPLPDLVHGRWRAKVYGIAYDRPAPRPELVDAAHEVARETLPATGGDYGVAFMGVHDGRGHCFVFVDWWADENELHHHVFVSPAAAPAGLEERTASGLSACVWDLAVLCFERDAWVSTVLANPDGPDVDAYFARRLSTDA
jgi:hypothetical protein